MMQGLMDLFGLGGPSGDALFGIDIDDPRIKMAIENLQANSNGGQSADAWNQFAQAPQQGMQSDSGLGGLMNMTRLQQNQNQNKPQFLRNQSSIQSLMGG